MAKRQQQEQQQGPQQPGAMTWSKKDKAESTQASFLHVMSPSGDSRSSRERHGNTALSTGAHGHQITVRSCTLRRLPQPRGGAQGQGQRSQHSFHTKVQPADLT